VRIEVHIERLVLDRDAVGAGPSGFDERAFRAALTAELSRLLAGRVDWAPRELESMVVPFAAATSAGGVAGAGGAGSDGAGRAVGRSVHAAIAPARVAPHQTAPHQISPSPTARPGGRR
jgi:hypothetical protein